MPRKSPSNTGRCASNTRTIGSAAAFAGVVGLPDPGAGPVLGDGGLYAFCHTFNRRFDELAATCRPEWRSVARAEREARG
jgi:hypothetical protein